MNDISDLASLNFEDLAQADLFDLVTSSSKEEAGLEEEDEEMRSRSCSPAWPGQEQRYTSITLINGEQICLRDTETRATTPPAEWGDSCAPDTMDLNSILCGGVVERVTSTVAPAMELPGMAGPGGAGEVSSTVPSSLAGPLPPGSIKTILASQLPLPVPARLRPGLRSPGPRLVISSSSLEAAATNNNSLLRSALTSKQQPGSVLLLEPERDTEPRTVLATVKVSTEHPCMLTMAPFYKQAQWTHSCANCAAVVSGYRWYIKTCQWLCGSRNLRSYKLATLVTIPDCCVAD